MDPREFDALVARLANGPTRRDALKGAAGGTLAAIGITAVDADSEARKKKRKKNNRGDKRDRDGGKNEAEAEKKKKKRKKRCKKKVTVCHNGQTIRISKCAKKKHLRHGDTLGPCYGG